MLITTKQITKGLNAAFIFILNMVLEPANIVAVIYQQNTNVIVQMVTNLKPMVVIVAWVTISINY